MNDNRTPRRRWFQFSLRTFFDLVTLVCAGFGYWVHWSKDWIRQRGEWESAHPSRVWYRYIEDRLIEKPAPSGLWLFGERGRETIAAMSEDEVREAKRIFSEAYTFLWTPRTKPSSLPR
jgi:hypothetical protein